MTFHKQKRASRTALIIEDNEDNRVLIESLMQWGGYHTRTCATGQSGYEAALQERPDLILLDIQLPDIDGFEVLHRIRASEIDGTIPIIAMTSYSLATCLTCIPRYAVRTLRFYASIIGIRVFDVGYALRTAAMNRHDPECRDNSEQDDMRWPETGSG